MTVLLANPCLTKGTGNKNTVVRDFAAVFGEVFSPLHDVSSLHQDHLQTHIPASHREQRHLVSIHCSFPSIKNIFCAPLKLHMEEGVAMLVYLNGIRSFYHVYSLISAAWTTEIVSEFFTLGGRVKRTKGQLLFFGTRGFWSPFVFEKVFIGRDLISGVISSDSLTICLSIRDSALSKATAPVNPELKTNHDLQD